jgi:hypothetical protein
MRDQATLRLNAGSDTGEFSHDWLVVGSNAALRTADDKPLLTKSEEPAMKHPPPKMKFGPPFA